VNRYPEIDKQLRMIEDSNPKGIEAVIRFLDGRVLHPAVEPFRSSGGWLKGFNRDAALARSWISKRRARLGLKSLPRGPK
jgi:hypothetical protein